jgi:cytidylate kinase
MKTVIAIAGKPGARTSRLGTKLSQALGVPSLQFGDFVRRLAMGKTTDLQSFGQKYVRKMGPVKFLELFLEQSQVEARDLLIIDGVRHVGIWNAIHSKYPRSFLICIDVPDSELIKRLMRRDGLDKSGALKRLAHPVESEFADLLCVASLVLNAEQGKAIVDEIQSHLTACLYHSWDEEDVVSKLHTLNATVERCPYIPTQQMKRGFYALITDSLRFIPFEHHEAAYAIFANVAYLTDGFISDVNSYLAFRIRGFVERTGISLADDVFVFDIDHSNLAEQLYRSWGVTPDIQLMKYNKTPAHLLNAILTTSNKSSNPSLCDILSKKLWILACDNVFSGESVLGDLKIMHTIIKSCWPSNVEPPQIVVCSQLFTQQAEEKILSQKGSLFDELFYGVRFDESCRVNTEECRMFCSRDTLSKVRAFCEWFAKCHLASLPDNHAFYPEMLKNAKSGHRVYAYGWRDGGYLIVRQSNTPNNSLPVLWWPQKTRIDHKKKASASVAKRVYSGEFSFPQTVAQFKYRMTDDVVRKGYSAPFPREPSFAAYDGEMIAQNLRALETNGTAIAKSLWH